MRHFLSGLTLAAITLGPSLAGADVRLTFGGGEVSLSAQNATVSQILSEWARIGQIKIVNGERVSSPPLTLELSHIQEAQALDIVLRNVAGYVLVMRPVANGTTSRYDRILILPTSTGARPAPPPPAAPNPAFQQPRPAPMRPEQDTPPDSGVNGQQPPRTPAFTPFPQTPQPAQPRGADGSAPPPATGPSPTPFGGGVTGSRLPGTITPPPAPVMQPAPGTQPAPNQQPAPGQQPQ